MTKGKLKKTEQQFTKAALIQSGRWKKDLLNAVLTDGESYTICQVEKLTEPFMRKGER